MLLVGVGEQRVTDFRRAGAAVARATKDRASVVTTITAIAPEGALEAFVVGAMLGLVRLPLALRPARASSPSAASCSRASTTDDGSYDDELARAIALGGAGWRARMLATVPSNLKNPAWLAEQAEELAADAGLEVTVWDEQAARRPRASAASSPSAAPPTPRPG